MFYLALPDTGSNKTWSWSWSVAPSDSAGLYILTFWKGIDTASPVRSSNGVQNAGGFPITTSTLTAQSGDLIVAFLGAFVGSGTGSVDSWTNLTLLENLAQGAHADGAWATGSPSGNTTVSAASATDMAEPSLSALVLKSASAGTFTPRSMLLGVG